MELISTKTCRVCISKPGDNPIDSNTGQCSFSEIIMIISKVQIRTNDNLPKTICIECTKEIENAYILKCMIEKNDLKLRQIFDFKESADIPEVVYIKTEEDENRVDNLNELGTHLDVDLIGKQTITEKKQDVSNDVECQIDDEKNVKDEGQNYSKDKENDDNNDSDFQNEDNNDPIKSQQKDDEDYDTDAEERDIDAYLALDDAVYDSDGNYIKPKRAKETKKRTYTAPAYGYPKRGKYKQDKKDKPLQPSRQPAICDQCGKVFKWPQGLKRHLQIHTGEKDFKCHICNMPFRNDSSLKVHLRRHVNDRRYKCKFCPKAFFANFDLRLHVAIHLTDDEKPFKCTNCPKRFHMHRLLNQHSKVHSKHQIACDYCDYTFSNEFNLRQHMKEHSDKLMHTCELCERKFATPASLNSHMASHTGEKRVACELCNRQFCNKKILADHTKRIHNLPEKTAECEICHRKFSTPNHLRIHLQTHSDVKIPFKCRYCGEIFGHARQLGAHQHEHRVKGDHLQNPITGSLHECSICSMKFSSANHLKTHSQKHSSNKKAIIKCRYCDEVFTNLKTLGHHQQEHREKGDNLPKPSPKVRNNVEKTSEPPPKLECNVCLRLFSSANHLRTHSRTHTGEKVPFKCKYCGKIFGHARYLGAHHKEHRLKGDRKMPTNKFNEISEIQNPPKPNTSDEQQQFLV